jgi:hypothetical protein
MSRDMTVLKPVGACKLDLINSPTYPYRYFYPASLAHDRSSHEASQRSQPCGLLLPRSVCCVCVCVWLLADCEWSA